MKTRRNDRAISLTVIVLAAAAMAGVMVFSPAALGWISRTRADWTQLSDVSETYGAAAAALSTLALAAVALSLVFQARQVRQARVQVLREAHLSLIKIALDDPLYFQCWGGPFKLSGADERLVAYTNLVLSFWEAKWDLGEMTTEDCAGLAANFFDSELGRLYWDSYGPGRSRSSARGRRAFYETMNAAFAQAVAAGPPGRLLER